MKKIARLIVTKVSMEVPDDCPTDSIQNYVEWCANKEVSEQEYDKEVELLMEQFEQPMTGEFTDFSDVDVTVNFEELPRQIQFNNEKDWYVFRKMYSFELLDCKEWQFDTDSLRFSFDIEEPDMHLGAIPEETAEDNARLNPSFGTEVLVVDKMTEAKGTIEYTGEPDFEEHGLIEEETTSVPEKDYRLIHKNTGMSHDV